MGLRRRRSVDLFEPGALSFNIDDPEDHGQRPKPRRRLYFHVTRHQDFGGNRAGHCKGVDITRAGTLIVFHEDNKRSHFAAGTWTDLVTEPPRPEGAK